MVLSIGMIVKNEEKYLERCLTALQPILDGLDSELIIADTGSTDRTVEIARKFTDNVFHFEWINDFAAARNSTLEKAQGEWYMFIDADEIARDCSTFIKFFKTGEYKKYHSASYVISSFNNEKDVNRMEFRGLRLTERNGVTKFLNPIHEQLAPLYGPVKNLDFIVDHYGYVFSDKEDESAENKSKRNLEYLFRELNELSAEEIQNNRFSIYDQIADCYEIIGDTEKALEYVSIGLENLEHNNFGIAPYYSHKLAFLLNSERLGEMIELGEEYFDKKKNPWHTKDFSTDCYVRAVCGYAYYKFKNYDKAIEYYSRFIELYGKHLRGKLETEDLFVNIWRVTEEIAKASFDVFFRCCYQEKRFALANDYTSAVPLELYFDDHNFMINHLNIRVEMMENVGYNKLDNLYRQLDQFGKDYLLTVVRRKVFSTTPQNRATIIRKFSALDGLPSELAKIYSRYFDKGSTDFAAISGILEKYGSENGEDMLYILLESQMDISPFLMTSDFFADRAVQLLITYFPNGTELYENYDISVISSEALVKAISLYGWVMRRVLENKRTISGLFKMYSDLGARWDSEFPNSTPVPGDVIAARLAGKVVAAKELGSRAEFNVAVHKLREVVPDLIPIVGAYRMENANSLRSVSVNPEFVRLAAQVKQNIRGMIAKGDFDDAEISLAELEQLCPSDAEIKSLKDEIYTKRDGGYIQ